LKGKPKQEPQRS